MPCSMIPRFNAPSKKILGVKPRSSGIARVLAIFFTVGVLLGCGDAGPDLPNLFLITVDQLAADRLPCFGGPGDAGRSVCALGQRGTLHAFAVSPGGGEASNAATVLTGLPEAVHGLGRDGQSFLADAHPTIAEDLSRAGYATAAFVTSPLVNRSRRLDRGFDLYEDRLASPSRMAERNERGEDADLSGLIRAWLERVPAPWFVWVHLNRNTKLVELDRLISGLSGILQPPSGGPGILFLALRGEAASRTPENSGIETRRSIGWRTHRVPLIWRPALDVEALDRPTQASVSYRLASLMDIVPTLRAAARLPTVGVPRNSDETPSQVAPILASGRELAVGPSMPEAIDGPKGERFLLLVGSRTGDVGLASQNHFYTRNASPLDGTGRPVATSSLIPLDARFASLPDPIDPLYEFGSGDARYELGAWRIDVLDPDSPVSRLEFYLARRLRTEGDARHIRPKRKNLQ